MEIKTTVLLYTLLYEIFLPLILEDEEKEIGSQSVLIFYIKHLAVLPCYVFSDLELKPIILLE